MRKNWDFETCKVCTREQRLVWAVDDVLWGKVVIDYYRNEVICLECFLRMADVRHVYIRMSDISITAVIANCGD